MNKPSHAATYERARRFANVALYTVALQQRRLRTKEPEDGEFLFRRWADFQFMIIALTRLRRAAVLAAKVPAIKKEIDAALDQYDSILPMLKELRDVAEHFDDYALDVGRLAKVRRQSLEVGFVSETTFKWLDDELDANVALKAGQRLFEAIKRAKSSLGAQL
jgi:hypothetical protein